MIKCSCKGEDCKTGVRVEAGGLWLTNKKGEECLMYLDANTTIKLIKELKVRLLKLTGVTIT